MLSGYNRVNSGQYPMFLLLLAVVSLQLIDISTGSQDAQGIAVLLNHEKVVPAETTWIYSGWLEGLYGMTADDVSEKAQVYFSLILDRSKNMFPLVINDLMVAIANALEGKVIYAKLLPNILGLYCDGHATFSALQFVHEVEVIIM